MARGSDVTDSLPDPLKIFAGEKGTDFHDLGREKDTRCRCGTVRHGAEYNHRL